MPAHAAEASGLQLTAPEKLDQRTLPSIEQLQNAGDFDRGYIELQNEAHDRAIDLFATFVEDGSDGVLHDFAARTLPVLKAHDRRIKDIQDRGLG